MTTRYLKLLLVLFLCFSAGSNIQILAQELHNAGPDTIADAEKAKSKKWHLSISPDYLFPGNAVSKFASIKKSICASGVYRGFGDPEYCVGSTRASGAGGFHITAFTAYRGIELGYGISYLNGGPGAGNINLRANNGGQLDYGSIANTMRFLGEARKTWRLSDSIGTRMGVGLGLAVNNQMQNCQNYGSTLLPSCKTYLVTDNDYSSLGWLTWEFSPALIYKDIALGVRYVGFGRGGRTPWHTYGAFLGVDLN